VRVSEILLEIENELSCLDLKDSDGNPLIGNEAAGVVMRFGNGEWEKLMDELSAGAISPEEYRKKVLNLIRGFSSQRIFQKVDCKISDLKLDQQELDIFPKGAA